MLRHTRHLQPSSPSSTTTGWSKWASRVNATPSAKTLKNQNQKTKTRSFLCYSLIRHIPAAWETSICPPFEKVYDRRICFFRDKCETSVKLLALDYIFLKKIKFLLSLLLLCSSFPIAVLLVHFTNFEQPKSYSPDPKLT